MSFESGSFGTQLQGLALARGGAVSPSRAAFDFPRSLDLSSSSCFWIATRVSSSLAFASADDLSGAHGRQAEGERHPGRAVMGV